MDGSLTEESCAGFARALAAKEAVPGGGGAAAYAGALAAALCSMVGAFTSGKARYAAVEGDVRRMLDEAQDAREQLLALVDEDARAFEPLSRAYAIPKEDPGREAALEGASRGACVAPLETLRQCARVVGLLEEMGRKGSRMLLSDVGCGAALVGGAARAAAMNVFVNTRPFAGRPWAVEAEEECDRLLGECESRARRLADEVAASVRS